jgi:opacity protein-like surface antigen
MKRFLSLFFLLPAIISCDDFEDYAFYFKVDSGISASMPANIVTVYPPWDEAVQGYESNLGNCAIAGFSVGCEFCDVVDLEVNISNCSIFEYRKFQTATNGDGSFTRTFDLSVTPLMLYANILGKAIPHLHLNIGKGSFYPIFGAGIGITNLLITNFRTVGLPVTGDSSPYNSFSAENEYTLRKNFSYAALAGFEYHHNDRWAIGTGYRWFDAGYFDGPQYLRVTNGSATDVASDAWQMRFRANEWFIEFKIFI